VQLAAGADPVAALDALLRQQRHQSGIGAGHVTRQHRDPQARAACCWAMTLVLWNTTRGLRQKLLRNISSWLNSKSST
jgi:hypothetical protein